MSRSAASTLLLALALPALAQQSPKDVEMLNKHAGTWAADCAKPGTRLTVSVDALTLEAAGHERRVGAPITAFSYFGRHLPRHPTRRAAARAIRHAGIGGQVPALRPSTREARRSRSSPFPRRSRAAPAPSHQAVPRGLDALASAASVNGGARSFVDGPVKIASLIGIQGGLARQGVQAGPLPLRSQATAAGFIQHTPSRPASAADGERLQRQAS
jgi:hypothetical protein